MGAHAVRSASGSKRWMACPGSIRLSDRLERAGTVARGSSGFAREGTAAHGLAEYCLRTRTHPSETVGWAVHLDEREDAHVVRADEPLPHSLEGTAAHGLAPVGAHPSETAGRAVHPDRCEAWECFPVDADMADAVAVFYHAVLDDLEEMGVGAVLGVEERFDLSWVVRFDFDLDRVDDPDYVSPSGIRYGPGPDGEGFYHADGRRCWGPMFGTGDATVLQPFDLLRVYDYKHGRGVLVEVEENSQELYYALGVARKVDWCFDQIELVIVQPRAAHADGPVRRWRTDAARLRAFEGELRAAALRTEDPDAPLAAGDHCQFCPAAPYCDELRAEAFRLASVEFLALGKPSDLPVATCAAVVDAETPEARLAEALAALPVLDAFVKAVSTEALRRLRETPGGEAFGYKLVRKRSNRAFLPAVPHGEDGEDADPFDVLVSLGFDRDDLYEQPRRKSPSKVEALRPPALVSRLKAEGVRAPVAWIKAQVAALTHKPEGGIAMAPASDPRPAVDPSVAASADFEAVEDDE